MSRQFEGRVLLEDGLQCGGELGDRGEHRLPDQVAVLRVLHQEKLDSDSSTVLLACRQGSSTVLSPADRAAVLYFHLQAGQQYCTFTCKQGNRNDFTIGSTLVSSSAGRA